MNCLFTSDLHGEASRYDLLFHDIAAVPTDGLFIGGDLLNQLVEPESFFKEHLFGPLRRLRRKGCAPRCFVILGNDDPRAVEGILMDAEKAGLVEYINERAVPFGRWYVVGYSYIPPTPFQLKDWEKYDVSRHVDPGCVSPENGHRSVDVPRSEIRYGTIAADLERLTRLSPPDRSLYLFHSPPYDTALDRADLDGRTIDHAPLDVHVGSIAIARFIEEKQPKLTLHGHVHEAPRLTGRWRERLGETVSISGCHDGPGVALVRFDPDHPGNAVRRISGD